VEFRWKSLDGLPVFVAHGTQDPVIPITMARRARQMFEGSNAAFTYREYPMGHEISEQSFSDVRGWMNALLDATPTYPRP
jgi:phospholipase/carboxylesterase